MQSGACRQAEGWLTRHEAVTGGAALQGREAQGRPLLERALRIQEAALGPDHPDVVAIRDVLMTEDAA